MVSFYSFSKQRFVLSVLSALVLLLHVNPSTLTGQTLAVHSISSGNGTGTISGSLSDGSLNGTFVIQNGSTTGYSNSNNPTASLSNGSGAGYNGITIQYNADDQCLDVNSLPFDQDICGSNQGDLGNDAITATYTVTPSMGSAPQIRVSQKLDGTNGNDEASTWVFTWSGGGTATWYDNATPEAQLYRFVVDGSHSPGNSELISNGSFFESGFAYTHREIQGASTTGTLSSGGSLTIYATNNNRTRWYIEFPIGVTSVSVTKTALTGSTGSNTGDGQRLPALGYGGQSSANIVPACTSISPFTDPQCQQNPIRIFQDGATFNEWISFGVDLKELGVISGTVLADDQNDGVFEKVLEGVVLTLKDSDGNDIDSDPSTPGIQPTTTETDATGNYTFDNLIPGSYQVVQTQPANYTSYDDTDGGTTGTENVIGDTNPIVVTEGMENSGNNFREILTSALPVTLVSFSASAKGNYTELKWTTTSEINNDRFEIEASSDGVSFKKVGQVKGKGNSTNLNEYTFVDYDASILNKYYRLKQVDYDGNFEYSIVVYASRNSKVEKFEIHPNPVTDLLHVEVSTITDMTIYSIDGKIVRSAILQKGVNSLNLSNLKVGHYFVKIGEGKLERIIKL